MVKRPAGVAAIASARDGRAAAAGLELYGIELRRMIKGREIVKRLCDHALAKTEMTATQIRAAEVVLRKCLPDLAAIQISGAGEGGAITITISKDDAAL